MAYNLNYNPGVEFEKNNNHRKLVIIFLVVLVFVALGIVLWIQYVKNAKNDISSDQSSMTDEQKLEIVQNGNGDATSNIADQKKYEAVSSPKTTSGEPVESSISREDKLKILNNN